MGEGGEEGSGGCGGSLALGVAVVADLYIRTAQSFFPVLRPIDRSTPCLPRPRGFHEATRLPRVSLAHTAQRRTFNRDAPPRLHPAASASIGLCAAGWCVRSAAHLVDATSLLFPEACPGERWTRCFAGDSYLEVSVASRPSCHSCCGTARQHLSPLRGRWCAARCERWGCVILESRRVATMMPPTGAHLLFRRRGWPRRTTPCRLSRLVALPDAARAWKEHARGKESASNPRRCKETLSSRARARAPRPSATRARAATSTGTSPTRTPRRRAPSC